MLDLMDIITETSKIFKREKQETTMKLMNLKQHIGKHSKEFYDNLTASKQFGDQKSKLKGAAPAAYKEDNDIKKLLENAISYLQSRFENFKEAPLVYFKIFNFKFWPREQEQLALFGGDDVQCIVDHYKEQLSGDECNKIPQELVALKSYVAHFCGHPLLQVYGELLRDRPVRFQNILVLVDLMLTLSPSTAECERQFSSIKRMKTALRNRLSNDSLQALMRINCDGPSDNDFDPEEAINKWLTSGPEGRHIAGHKVPVPEFQFLIDLQHLLQLQLHLHSVSLKVKQYLQPFLMLKGRAKQKKPMLDLLTFTLLTLSQVKQFNLHVEKGN